MNLCSTNVKVYWSLHCVKKAIEINRGTWELGSVSFCNELWGEKCINEAFQLPSILTPVFENGTF